MKILFYAEPHPIRQSHTNHFWIVSKFLDMLEDEFINKKYLHNNVSVRIVASRGLHAKIQQEKDVEVHKHFLIGLTQEENNHILQNFDTSWDDVSIDIWNQLMSGEGEVSLFYEKIINRIHKTVFDFDVIVYWGTNGAVRNFAKKNNIPAIAMELGCTRKPLFDSLYFDFMGVNGSAYTNKIDIESMQDCLTLEEIKEVIPFTTKYAMQRDALYTPLATKHRKTIYENIGKNILIPLQLADDANILQYSKYSSMKQFLEEILPVLTGHGFVCYVKPHPGNIYREYNMQDHKEAEEYCKNFSNVIWIDDVTNEVEYHSLLMKMDAVVVVNSSVGFEAMCFGKIVVQMGKSPYNLSDALPNIKQLAEGKLDFQKYQKLITKVVNLLLFHYLTFKDTGFTFAGFLDNVKYNIDLHRIYHEDKKKFQEKVFICNRIRIDDYFNFPSMKLNGLKKKNKTVSIEYASPKLLYVRKMCYTLKMYKIEYYIKKSPFLFKMLKKVKKDFLHW